MTLMRRIRAVLGAVAIGWLAFMCGCQGLRSGLADGNGGIQSVNHIVLMVQENRSFDTYFGQLPAYWKANGYPQAMQQPKFDGLPANASNPSYDRTTNV